MLRLLSFLIGVAILGSGGWWAWENSTAFQSIVNKKMHTKEFQTLEIRYTAEQLMQMHRESLLKNNQYTFLEPTLAFYPYLLMQIKYSRDAKKTSEGILLWSLTDGEMVLDATRWEKTHGFEDCLLASAEKNDFNILRALIRNGGKMDREKLYHTFNVESETVDQWIESCCRKKLIISNGNQYRLHFENPRLEIYPQTQFDQCVVSQMTLNALRMKRRYSPSQIKNLTVTAFGKDFAIRFMNEVFLPVYSIPVQNPDGSILTTYWNALNGQRLLGGQLR